MPRFHFALEPLLRARRQVEQERQRAVAMIERERLALEDRLRTQQQLLAGGKQSMRSALDGRIDMPALRMQAASSIQLLRSAQRLALELAGVHQRLKSARDTLLEATRQRRAVELLREKRHAEWTRMVEKAETDAADELAVIAAARRSGKALSEGTPIAGQRAV